MSERATRECSDVADDRDLQPVEPAEGLAHRVEVEQRLRRMLVLAVARVHDARVGQPRDESAAPDLRVADHDHVRVVGRERERGVLQRLALVDRRARRLSASSCRPRAASPRARTTTTCGSTTRRRRSGPAGRAASAASCCRAPARARTSARSRAGARRLARPRSAIDSRWRRSVAGGSRSPPTTRRSVIVGLLALGRRASRGRPRRPRRARTCTRSPRAVGRFLPT